MRIGLLADIPEDALNLRRALREFDRQRIDHVVVLEAKLPGKVGNGELRMVPAALIDRVMAEVRKHFFTRPGCYVIL